MVNPLALVCSVQLEAEPVLAAAAEVKPLEIPRLDAWSAVVAGQPAYVVVGGMGKTNAGRSLTALLERRQVRAVVGFGVAGAYPGAGLRIGDVAIADAEHYGDEGVETPYGWLSCSGIGIPLLDTGTRRYFNDFPVDRKGLVEVTNAFAGADRPLRVGPFVTLSNCSGTAARAAVFVARYGAVCETMEGAAYAHVAALYGLPFLEVRGVSNLVEDRDLATWDLAAGARAASEALILALPVWQPMATPENAERE